MSDFNRKIEQVLADKFDVPAEFSACLRPLLRKLAERGLGAEDWQQILDSVSAAWRAGREQELECLDETRVLIREFVGELKKMDESLKVLGVYLERLRERSDDQPAPRLLH